MTDHRKPFEMLDQETADRLGISLDENSLGIVSVWADRSGRALVWQRDGTRVTCTEERFRPWLFAATLEDLAHVGATPVEETAPRAERAPFCYRELDGPPDSYRYLL